MRNGADCPVMLMMIDGGNRTPLNLLPLQTGRRGMRRMRRMRMETVGSRRGRTVVRDIEQSTCINRINIPALKGIRCLVLSPHNIFTN